MSHLQAKNISVEFNRVSDSYEIRVEAGLLASIGEFARKSLDRKTRQICLISNAKVFGFYGERAQISLENAGFRVFSWLMKDGERYKNLRSLETALGFLSQNKFTRNDAVIALGGGVAGDLAGFAAAVYQRGIPFLQVPTTVLAQIDSSVGGKTGINTNFGKNLVGAFHQPAGVLVDVETLQTLPQRELQAGFYEIVKHAALSGTDLLNQTSGFLQKFPLKKHRQHFAGTNRIEFLKELQSLISSNINFKAQIVANDERENANRDDARSRKILNFGHTAGHAIEKITDYRRFKHGEAVAYGMRAAIEISKRLGKLPQHELNLLNEVLHSVGKLPNAENLSPEKIIEAFVHDKKASGDSFKWILLERIGSPLIIDDKDIPEAVVSDSLRSALQS